MIEGIKLDFTSDQLKAHVGERIVFHSQKEKWYQQQVLALRSGGVRPDSGVSNDPVTSLERSMSDHAQKAGLFQVIADHIVSNEVYRLSESDLSRLEFISRYY